MTSVPQHILHSENSGQRDDEIDLTELIRTLWKSKFIIGTVMAVTFILAGLISHYLYPKQYITKAGVLLNFPGIEEYKNPDGTPFNKEQVIAPNILYNAVGLLKVGEEKGDALIGEIRSLISIEAVIPDAILKKIERAEKKNEPFDYAPNLFHVLLLTEGKMEIPELERDRILYAVIRGFKEYFTEKYGQEPVSTYRFPDDMVERYDYLETIDILLTSSENLNTFLANKTEAAGFFRSKNGSTFFDLKNQLEMLQQVEIQKTRDLIHTFKLTKDTRALISQYQYKIREFEKNKDKKEGEAEAALRLLNTVMGQKTRVGPAAADTSSGPVLYDQSFLDDVRKNDYYSLLLKVALDAEVAAVNMRIDKKFLLDTIDALGKADKNGNNGGTDVAEIEKSLIEIKDRLNAISKASSNLNKEYLASTIEGAIRIVSEPETYIERDKHFFLVIFAAVMGMGLVSVFLVLVVHHMRSEKRMV